MPRWGIAAGGTLVFLLVIAQLLIPNLAEREFEQRLTEGGGQAQVTLGAIPAARLLFGDGERLEIVARDLDLGLEQDLDVFDRLDGFGVVDIAIDDFRAGPFELEHFELERGPLAPYRLASSGHTSPAALVDYGLEAFDLPGGPFAGLALETLLDDADLEIPIELDMTIASAGGRVEVIGGDTTVGGLPAGPFAELITSAIVVQL